MVHEKSVDNRTIPSPMNKSDENVLAVEPKEQGHVVCVARGTTLQQMSETPIFVNRNGSGNIQVDSYTQFGNSIRAWQLAESWMYSQKDLSIFWLQIRRAPSST